MIVWGEPVRASELSASKLSIEFVLVILRLGLVALERSPPLRRGWFRWRWFHWCGIDLVAPGWNLEPMLECAVVLVHN